MRFDAILVWRLVFALSFLFCLPAISYAQAPTVTVSFKGCVNPPKVYSVQVPVRLFAVLQLASTQSCVYWNGASWLKEDNKAAQKVQKTALLEDLTTLIDAVEGEGVKNHLTILREQLAKMPVTGREVPSDLDPFRVETRPLKNRLVVEDSVFWLPKRPSRLHFLGFERDQMAYFSNQTVSEYWQKNPLKPQYEKGWVYVVQANGEVGRHKVGYWTHEKVYASPGSWIVAPLKKSIFKATEGEVTQRGFYRRLTQWLATQAIEP